MNCQLVLFLRSFYNSIIICKYILLKKKYVLENL